MQYINSELGIRVKQDFADMKYVNAGGGRSSTSGRNKMILTKLSPLAFGISLFGDAKKRAKEVMGSASNPIKEKMEHYKKDIVAPKYPFSSEMSSDKLESILTSLTNDYNYENSRLPELINKVANNSKSFSVEPNRSTIATIQDVRGMMQVVSSYRDEVAKAYDKAFAREEKAAETPTPTPSPSLNPLGTPSPAPSIGGGTGASLTPRMGGALEGDVKIGGKEVKKSYLLFGGLALGVLGFLYLRSR